MDQAKIYCPNSSQTEKLEKKEELNVIRHS